MRPALAVCPTCGGTGTVPHQRRTLGNDAQGTAIPDPHDHQTVELCSRCGGSGKVAAQPGTREEESR